MHKQGFRVLETLEHVATAHSATAAQIALAWIMAQPGITSAIASATSAEQTHELLGAIEISLSQDQIQALSSASVTK